MTEIYNQSSSGQSVINAAGKVGFESPDSKLSKRLVELSHRFRQGSAAKRLLFSVLGKMKHGSLTVVDSEGEYFFGDPNALYESDISARIDVHDSELYKMVISHGVLGAGEAYMAAYWSSPDLVSVVRFMTRNITALQEMNSRLSWVAKFFMKLFSRATQNSLVGSKRNISAHYDLGNAFFSLFLDKRMMYSAAVFDDKIDEDKLDLERAAEQKLKVTCEKLQLCASDHLLEIGTGWGGLAVYAAENYGCQVTTTTISDEQFSKACALVNEKGLADKVTVLKKDYRLLAGQYDKLVSIEMIEAVGHKYFATYFEKCSTLLKDDGLMLIQAITIADQRYDQYKSSMDFIRKYIFPGGCLPSHKIIADNIKSHTDMSIIDTSDMSYDYALTLNVWRTKFFEKISQVKAQGYPDQFIRMWDYYLCYCEGGFRERVIGTSQFVFAKPYFDTSDQRSK